ncbi:MAG: SMC-Scp complex subunit ScpB [Dehalococcoidia bacterium]
MTSRRHQAKIDPPAPDRLPAVIESLLFVAEEPQEIGALSKSLGVPRQRIERAIEQLVESVNGRGLLIQRLGDRVQLATAPDAAPYIERFLEVTHGRLSRAALETLAIIAYRNPITRARIESVRGVNSDQSVATLQARGLVEEVGRAPGPGRPVLFGTTVRFLEYFGLQRLDDLPPLPAIEEDGMDSLTAGVNGLAALEGEALAEEGEETDEGAEDGPEAWANDDAGPDDAASWPGDEDEPGDPDPSEVGG